MGSLLHYLTTGEGADLILICNGELFFVHKTVVAANSPTLKEETRGSGLFDGEACMLNDLAPNVLGKILTFMYRGDIPESYRKSLASSPSARLPLNQKFPLTDKFLTTVRGKPATVELNDGTSRTTDTVTNKEKWAIMLKKQAELKDPYDMVSCTDYAEVIDEVDVYVVAEKLEILALKEVSMRKVTTWFEVQLQTGLPLSDDFRTCALYVLQEHADFAKPFISLCAKHLSVIEKDTVLASLIEEMRPITWNAMLSVRQQSKAEMKQQQEDPRKTKTQLQTLETRIAQHNETSNGLENVLKSQVQALSRSLALAEGRMEAAEAMVRRLESLNRTLQQEALEEKASALRLRDTNRSSKETKSAKLDLSHPKVAVKIDELQKAINSKDRDLEQLRRVLRNSNSQKPDAPSQKLLKQVEELKRMVHSKEMALEQSRSANDQVKTKLRGEVNGMRTETEKMKGVFDSLMNFVNQEDNCPSCRRHWNIKIGHKRNTAISIACKRCSYKGWCEGSSR